MGESFYSSTQIFRSVLKLLLYFSKGQENETRWTLKGGMREVERQKVFFFLFPGSPWCTEPPRGDRNRSNLLRILGDRIRHSRR